MNRHYSTDISGIERSYVLNCYIVDDYGYEWEVAGSYYTEHPAATMLHKHMKIVNYAGALYHFNDTISTN